jgi:hypothetical protein
MKKDNPCHGCNDRHASCHSSCKAYMDWHDEHVQKQREIRSKIEAENMTNAFYIESGIRIKKDRRRK